MSLEPPAGPGEALPEDGVPEVAVPGGAAPEGVTSGDAGLRLDQIDPYELNARATRRAERRQRARRIRRRRILVGAFGVLLLLVIAVVAWYEIESHQSGHPGSGVVVTIGNDEATGQVIDTLSDDGVISSPLAFRISDLLNGTPNVEPGSYYFHRNVSFAAARQALAGGPDVFSFTIPSGFTLAEVAEKAGDAANGYRTAISEDSLLAAAKSGAVRSPYDPAGSTDLEGLVADGTFQVLPDETDDQLLQQMVDRFVAQAQKAGLPAAAKALDLTDYQVAVIASVVEKEGYVPVNMGPVARVILNRLAAGMPLQMDATVLYAIGQDGGPVTPADEQIQSPYNSYLNTGLPPTPICIPSTQALHAASNPPQGAWLYFELVNKNGTEAFADTYAEQLANEQLAATRGLG